MIHGLFDSLLTGEAAEKRKLLLIETAAGRREGKTQTQQDLENEDHDREEEEEEEDQPALKEGEVVLRLFDHHGVDGAPSFMEIAVPRQALVSRIPYFATLFSEPWNATSSTSNRKNIASACLAECPNRLPILELECSPLSSCKAYYRFFELLKSAMADGISGPFPRGMLGSINEAVELLPIADHLLFHECIDVCMEYLARRPWSVEDEALIRGTLISINVAAAAAINPDLQARLDSGSNMDLVFERTCRFLVSPKNASLYPAEFFKACLTSRRSKQGIQNLLMRIWVAETPRVCEQTAYNLPKSWMDLSLSLLEYHPDARIVIQEFAEKSQILTMYSKFRNHRFFEDNYRSGLNGLLLQVFKHASSGNIPLSNSQCLALLKMWDEYVQGCADLPLSAAFVDVYKTLPLNDEAVFDFACMEAKRFAYLSSQLLSYVNGFNILMTDTTNSTKGKGECADV